MTSNYGTELIGERAKRRITQGQLAEKTGLYVQTILDIEQDRIGIDEETYRRLVDCLHEIAIATIAATEQTTA